jgi:hypothetical protein
VTSSTQESSSRAAWKVFNNAYAESDGWRGTGTYSTSNGSFTGTWVDFSSGSQTISTPDRGDWLQIILPEKIRLEAIRLQPRYSPTTLGGTSLPSYGRSEFIRNGAIWGSNDGSSWDKVYTINSGLPRGDTSMMTFDDINSTTVYNYFVLVITHTSGTSTGTLASFSEWELYGTPEYDSDAHGTDVVVKSVPNVPNTDWLDIYIDGQDYSTMPSGAGSVLDKSTNNRHGTPSNVTFNSTWKAFEIESASTSNITVPFNSTGGAYVHTIALWFWMDTTASDPTRGDSDRCLFTIRGSESAGRQIALIVNQDDTNVGFKYDFYGADVRYHDPSVVANKWMHVALTYSGGNNSIESKEIYLNGVRLGVAAQNSNPLNLTGTENLLIGGDLNSGNVSFEGMVANFRMFNRVLSKDEIYQLYAYQKEYFGHGDLSMTLKAGRLGIGTSEPRAALDVRGDIYAPGVSIQTVAENVHDIVTYPSATSRTISPLTIRITPKFATSKILLQWMINIELGENNVFSIYRNGIKTGYNTSVPDNIWVGAMSAAYDLNVDSTPENMYLAWIDTPNTTGVLEYTIVVRSASTSSFPVYFNRSATGAAVGQTNREIMVSFKCATEIA